MISFLLGLTALLSSPPVATAEIYEYDFTQVLRGRTPSAMTPRRRQDGDGRDLQTSGGTVPDLIAPTQLCNTLGGLYFTCDLHQRVGNSGDDYMDLNTTVTCGFDVTTGFDFRRVGECTCSTLLTPSNTSRLPKTCPCFVCPRNFGSSSFSVDCSYLLEDDNATETMEPTPFEDVTMTPLPPADGAVDAATDGSTVSPLPPVDGATQGSTVTAATDPPVLITFPPEDPPVENAGNGSNGVSAAEPLGGAVRYLQATTALPTTTLTMAPSSDGEKPDPYIFDTCVSIDCGANCNGTCSIGCSEERTAETCPFCSETFTEPPTGAPLDGGDGGVPTIGEGNTPDGAPTNGGGSSSSASTDLLSRQWSAPLVAVASIISFVLL